MLTIESTKLGKPFMDAYRSLWWNRAILTEEEQIQHFWEKFGIKIHNLRFDEFGKRIWQVTFPDESTYVMFILEWS